MHCSRTASAQGRPSLVAGQPPVGITRACAGGIRRSGGSRLPAAASSTVETLERVSTESSSFVSKEARKALFCQRIPGTEKGEEIEASISGTVPSWLNGSLLLNGGAEFTGKRHMFDGLAMVAKLRFENGRVLGSQKFAQSRAFQHFSKTGKMLYREFATALPKGSLADQIKEAIEIVIALILKKPFVTDNPSVSIAPLPNGKALLMSESMPSTYLFDPSTLTTLENRKSSLPGDLTTAHPKTLPDGTLVNFNRSFPLGGYHVFKQDPETLEQTQIAFIRDRSPLGPAWVHDLVVTRRHAVIIENPIFINIPALVGGGDRTHAFMDWKPEQGTRVYVVPLDPADPQGVRTYAAPTFFTFHHANAFEEDGVIHVDTAGYEDADIINDLFLDRLMEFPGQNVSRSGLRRLSIPLAAGAEKAELAGPRSLMDEATNGFFCEFPSVNPAKRGIKHRYVWANAAVRPTNMGNALSKLDTETGKAQVWHEAGALPGEPCFVPAPNATEEDDGVLMSVVMSASGSSFVLLLDGRTMKELARAQLPYAVPYRFHGAFVPAAMA